MSNDTTSSTPIYRTTRGHRKPNTAKSNDVETQDTDRPDVQPNDAKAQRPRRRFHDQDADSTTTTGSTTRYGFPQRRYRFDDHPQRRYGFEDQDTGSTTKLRVLRPGYGWGIPRSGRQKVEPAVVVLLIFKICYSCTRYEGWSLFENNTCIK